MANVNINFFPRIEVGHFKLPAARVCLGTCGVAPPMSSPYSSLAFRREHGALSAFPWREANFLFCTLRKFSKFQEALRVVVFGSCLQYDGLQSVRKVVENKILQFGLIKSGLGPPFRSGNKGFGVLEGAFLTGCEVIFFGLLDILLG